MFTGIKTKLQELKQKITMIIQHDEQLRDVIYKSAVVALPSYQRLAALMTMSGVYKHTLST